jgi:hypothetical protein
VAPVRGATLLSGQNVQRQHRIPGRIVQDDERISARLPAPAPATTMAA